MLLFLLLAWLTPLGYGNEGSSTGSCYCNNTVTDSPRVRIIEYLQNHLKGYDRCTPYVRFHLPSRRTVCGGSKEQWVIELVNYFNRREYGHDNRRVVHRKHLPPPSTQVPELTKRSPSDVRTPTQRYPLPTLLQSTQQPTLPAGRLSLDKKLTHANETSTSSVSDSLEAGENQKQMKENMGPTAEISAMVPVLSLLAIFILTGVLLYVLCKRKKQSLQYPPGKLGL